MGHQIVEFSELCVFELLFSDVPDTVLLVSDDSFELCVTELVVSLELVSEVGIPPANNIDGDNANPNDINKRLILSIRSSKN